MGARNRVGIGLLYRPPPPLPPPHPPNLLYPPRSTFTAWILLNPNESLLTPLDPLVMYYQICTFTGYSLLPIRKFTLEPWLVYGMVGYDRLGKGSWEVSENPPPTLPVATPPPPPSPAEPSEQNTTLVYLSPVGRPSNDTIFSIDFFSNCSGKKLKGWFLALDEQSLLVTPLGFLFCE